MSALSSSVPAAIGAALATQGRPVVALVGDGALRMTGMEMLTAAHHRLGILFVVLADGALAQIADFQRRATGKEQLTSLPDMDYCSLAGALGLTFLKVGAAADIPRTLAEAHATCLKRQPVLLAAHIDYSVSTYFTKGIIKSNQHLYVT